MCRTMNELEKVVADYRALKAMKEQLEEELKAVEREIIGYLNSNEKLCETDLGSLVEYQRVSQYRRLYVK